MKAFEKRKIAEEGIRKARRRQHRTFAICLLCAVMMTVALFALFGCSVKKSSAQSSLVQLSEHANTAYASDNSSVSTEQEARIMSGIERTIGSSWLNGSSELEVTERMYNIDSFGNLYLTYESSVKRKEQSAGGSRSELSIFSADSTIKSRKDSCLASEQSTHRSSATHRAISRSKYEIDARAPWRIVILVGIVVCAVWFVFFRVKRI